MVLPSPLVFPFFGGGGEFLSQENPDDLKWENPDASFR